MTLCLCLFSNFQNNFRTTVPKDWFILKQSLGRLPNLFVHRTLLSESTTKIEQYKRQRIFRVDFLQHQGKVELFKTLNGLTSAEETMQHISKVIDATHCVQNGEDCQIVEKVLKLFMASTVKQTDKFAFGAALIRMYHYLNMPDEAYAAYKNVEFGDLFIGNTCHLLLMDLLYKHGKYSRAVEVFFDMKKFNIDGTTLVFGSLYHINTPDSLTESQSFLIHVIANYALTRRAVLFAAMHALNQNDPSRAIETLKFCKPDSVARNIELMSLCELQRVSDVLSHLYDIQFKTNDISKLWGLRIYHDAWYKVLAVMKNEGTSEEQQEFEDLKIQLKERGVLSPQLTKIFLEQTIPSESDFKKERAKRIIYRKTSKHPP